LPAGEWFDGKIPRSLGLAQSGVGFVSLERILREAPAAQRAQKKLEQEFAPRGLELSRLAEQLKKMQESLEKNAVTMSESESASSATSTGTFSEDSGNSTRIWVTGARKSSKS